MKEADIEKELQIEEIIRNYLKHDEVYAEVRAIVKGDPCRLKKQKYLKKTCRNSMKW